MSDRYVERSYVECLECGREYRAHGLWHSRQYDSPGWFEVDPSERVCPECCEKLAEAPDDDSRAG